ncbi:hypothetical protein LCGC14_0521300 [marine sediment metagenome]|uniref:Uncharacterized protein n=1 Tax=marine sediment metagenome TaxID=412755 RepID=A0A0F9RYE2_9ZZZZ
MTKEKLEKGIKLQTAIEQANNFLKALKNANIIEFGFRTVENNYYDPKQNPIFIGYIYLDLKDIVRSYSEEKLIKLIEDWKRELADL